MRPKLPIFSGNVPIFSTLLQMLRNLSNFKLAQEIAYYLKAKFRATLHGTAQGIPFPLHWTLDLLDECNGIVVVLVEAFKHPSESRSPAHMIISSSLAVRTAWDATRYCDTIGVSQTGQNHKAEDQILKRYPPIYLSVVHKTAPFVVTDMHKNALVWYLPDILSETRQVCDHGRSESILNPLQRHIWKSLKILEPALRMEEKATANWRNHVMHYRPAEHCQLKPGTVSLSPAWFQQGHEV